MNIAIVATEKRSLGATGGVAKFNWYLQRAIGGEILYKEELKNRKFDIIIADGYNINDFCDRKDTKLISIVHGSIHEFAIRTKTENANTGPMLWQLQAWNKDNVLKVAVSESAKYYAEKHTHCKIATVIHNGIDENIYIPIKHTNQKPIILHNGSDYNKTGLNRLNKIIDILSQKYDFKHISAKVGEEPIKIASGDVGIHPSCYEGNSYLVLEMLSCGLPIISSKSGLFEYNIIDSGVGEIVPWDASPEQYSSAVNTVFDNLNKYNPRDFILENYTYNKFESYWKTFINNI